MPPRKRRPRGLIGELPSGSFRARVYAGVDPLTRKTRYLRETHKTYAAAEMALTRLQSQVDEDRHPRGDLTVRQAVMQWLEVADLAATTRERYDDLIRLYVLRSLATGRRTSSTSRSSTVCTSGFSSAGTSATAGARPGTSAGR